MMMSSSVERDEFSVVAWRLTGIQRSGWGWEDHSTSQERWTRMFWRVILSLSVMVSRGAAHSQISDFWRGCRFVIVSGSRWGFWRGCRFVIVSGSRWGFWRGCRFVIVSGSRWGFWRGCRFVIMSGSRWVPSLWLFYMQASVSWTGCELQLVASARRQREV